MLDLVNFIFGSIVTIFDRGIAIFMYIVIFDLDVAIFDLALVQLDSQSFFLNDLSLVEITSFADLSESSEFTSPQSIRIF